jgi:hypothetical protein
MKRTFITLFTGLALAGCATGPVVEGPVQLGDSERTMIAKMAKQGARDVTKETSSQFYAAIILKQRYYWWELPDKTVVAILVAAPPKKEKTVQVIETGEPGLGIEGIKRWRSQNLKQQSLLSK